MNRATQHEEHADERLHEDDENAESRDERPVSEIRRAVMRPSRTAVLIEASQQGGAR
jgi:hypothetical protein